MVQKEKRNFSIPAEVLEAFDEAIESLGKKEQWVATTAALLLLIEMPEEQRTELYGRVFTASVGDSLRELLREAERKSKSTKYDATVPPARAGHVELTVTPTSAGRINLPTPRH